MLSEIYLWLESRSGIPYNLEDEIAILNSDIIATDNVTWMIKIRNVIDLTKDAIETVNDYEDQIPDDFPNARQIKALIADYARNNVRMVMIKAFRTLGMDAPDGIEQFTLVDLWNMTKTMNDLVDELATNDIDDVIKSQWFDKYDEDHNNILTEIAGIYKQDITNISYAIRDIREYHEEDEEE